MMKNVLSTKGLADRVFSFLSLLHRRCIHKNLGIIRFQFQKKQTKNCCSLSFFARVNAYVSERHNLMVLSCSRAAEAIMFSVGWQAVHRTTSENTKQDVKNI